MTERPPKMAMPWDAADAIFTDQQHFMEKFAEKNDWASFDQQYQIASIKLLTKIAFELEKVNRELSNLNLNRKATDSE